jgi:predicted ATPase/class 3 adenylate cyclase
MDHKPSHGSDVVVDDGKDLGETTPGTGADSAVRHEPRQQQPGVILTPDQRVRVFISSTLEELAAERAAARRAIARLHLVPVWYESGARPHPPRSMYRAYLAQSQIFVGIYWQRYGWVAPGMDISGLEDEYRLGAGKPMLLYLKRPAPSLEPRLAAMIDSIRAAGTVSYRTFATPRELERLLADDLAVLLSESFAGAAVGGAAPGASPAGQGDPGEAELPDGTVTFLLTDIEGSTRLWENAPAAMEEALERHNRVLAGVIEDHGGVVVTSRGEGDSFFAVFPSAVAAVEAAGECQFQLNGEAWPEGGAVLRVRMGLHTGEARVRGGNYVDHAPINRAARVKAAAHGGQVLLTKTTRDLVEGRLGGGFGLKRLGEFRLRDLAEPELIYQLTHADLPVDFPPIRTVAERTTNLPVQVSSFIGRARELEHAAAALEEARLVTLTGPGGIGKTRLAVALGEQLQDRFAAGVVFVPLAAVTDPGLVLDAVARAVGAGLGGAGSPLQALAEWFGSDRWLLILDNLEQVVSAAGELGELLARCRGVVILATSRAALGLAAEHEYPVPPLPLPVGSATVPLAELASSPAVALFADRARAVRPGFALTEGNAAAVAEICRRLEGLPLAIELAAARTRLLEPGALLDRLSKSLDALGTGAVDLPERQRTLRATVEWSVGLLDDVERSLLEIMAVFVDGWTVDAAAQVAGLEEDRALELLEALARHSLIQLDLGTGGSRCRMLETVRAFMAERLAGRPDAAEVQRRHAEYYRALVGQADRPLRGAGQGEWLERLETEARNLAVAGRWYLAYDPEPLPHLFRILWPFWYLRDRQAQARPWVEELLPAAASPDPQARAELEWAAAVTANEVGDDAAALAASRRLEPLLEEIQDPFLHGICHLAIAWTSPISGDFEGALRELSASLEDLRGQDEPFFTALAAFTAGAAETNLGRPDGALRHLAVMRELADRFGYTWLTASAGVLLGTLAIVQGRLDQARDLLDEALDLSLAIRIIRNVTLCVDAFAELAFAEGDPGRAALLAGAADGLRRRAGFSTWPMLRQREAELSAQIRQALGDDRFGQAFAAGSRLSQQEAVTAIRDHPTATTSSPNEPWPAEPSASDHPGEKDSPGLKQARH